jgi:periplasmic copper chaperone A
MFGKSVTCATFTIIALYLSPAAAHGAGAKPDLSIQGAWARPTAMTEMGGDMKGQSMKGPAMGGTSAVYLTLVNKGDAADALVAARSDAANVVELHKSEMKGNVMRMVRVPRVEVPARGRTELKPGGFHLMLIGLKRDLKPGEVVKLTLRFEKSGEKEVTARVRKP